MGSDDTDQPLVRTDKLDHLSRTQLEELVRDLQRELEAARDSAIRLESNLRVRQTLTQLQSIKQHSPDLITMIDREGRYLMVNHAVAQVLGREVEQIVGKSFAEILPPDTAALFLNRLETVLEMGEPLEVEDRVQADGEERVYATILFPLFDPEGTCYAVGGIARDITERKRVEEALEASEERFRTIVDALPQFISYTDRDLVYRFVNRTYQEKFGIITDDVLGKTLPEVIGKEAFEKARHHVERALKGEQVRYHERYDYAIGGTRDIDGILVPNIAADGEVRGYYAVLTDITPYMEMQHALRQSEARYLRLLNALQEGVWAIDAENRTTFVNPRMSEMLGYSMEEMQGRSLFAFMDEAGVEIARRQLAHRQQGAQEQHEFQFLHKDGHYVYALLEAAPIRDETGQYRGAIAGVIDITLRKRAEEQLRDHADQLEEEVAAKIRQLEQDRVKVIQMDRMAALGELATGIAHELRQPLTAVSFEADYLKRVGTKAEEEHRCDLNAVLDPSEVRKIGENLEEDLARCRRLIDHLREFGRISQEPPAPVSLNRPIRDSLRLVGARLRDHDVTVHLDLAEDLPPILADRFKLEQVFLNLISNAEHAMVERDDGRPDLPKVLEITTTSTGDQVIATVHDNGCGMSQEVRARVFEPFFTTKPPGKGTGLGLSIGYGIVDDYGGEISCQSTPGQGTTFTLHFPTFQGEEQSS